MKGKTYRTSNSFFYSCFIAKPAIFLQLAISLVRKVQIIHIISEMES